MHSIRLSRLTAVLLALTLAACATPPRSNSSRAAGPASTAAAKKPAEPTVPAATPESHVTAVADCIQSGAQKWGIPADYLQRQATTDGGIVLTLVNPYSGKRGLRIELTPDGRHAEANLDDNGTVVSAKWRGLVSRCAGGG